MQHTDAELWELFRTGRPEAFELLYRRFYAVLFRYGRTFTHDDKLVEDCIQDLFLNLHRYGSNLKPMTDGVAFYLLASLRNMLFRQLTLLSRLRDAYPLPETGSQIELSVEDALIIRQLSDQQIQQLNQALEQLPERQREAIVLKFYSGLSFEQIAQVMGVNHQSAKNFIQKGLEALRQRIGPAIRITQILYGSLIPILPYFFKKSPKR
ncbi:RNA polymerase sigma factor [Larkinella sp. C7]|jgi:RNA polymerase sigma factor (sigma-70 family)|uniref:RNA polymerase sigma factor n=1 Tax=Larkinella sp. C7 TaxID=2576607 RepID=UPI0011112293|nr:sigma-70 family RNA polymerase sigma factor [Larkinella sp. C7]